MSSKGLIPRADAAIFADPMAELQDTYAYYEFLVKWQKENDGIPIIRGSLGDIHADLLSGFAKHRTSAWISPPVFTRDAEGNVGMIQRQCTDWYKIECVNQEIRKLYGLKPKQRNKPTYVYLGITSDESGRQKFSRNKWQRFYYPFLSGITTNKVHRWTGSKPRKFMNRGDCVEWLKANNLPIPPKSACFFCPFQSDARWKNMKINDPETFELACVIDDKIRNSTRAGIKQPVYLHRSCVPLREVNFNENQIEMFDSCISGHCGL